MKSRICIDNQIMNGEGTSEGVGDWQGSLSSFSDTYIEWRFECKCRTLNDGHRIFVEWSKQKHQFISIMSTIVFDFQHYSRHDATHSVCILERIEQILGKERIDLLSAGDLWLILQVAYSHDIGMALTYEQLLNLWEKDEDFKDYLQECLATDMNDMSRAALFMKEADNLIHQKDKMAGVEGKEDIEFEDNWPVLCQYYLKILVSEYIRKYHAIRVEEKYAELDSEKNPAIPIRLYKLAMEVNQMHARDFQDILKNLKKRTDGFGKEKIHPQFVAVLLRIGDLLDIDNNRFDPYVVEHFGRLPLLSFRHLKKHQAITHICVSENEISAEAETNEYEVAVLSYEWFQSIDREVVNLICYWNELVPDTLRGCRMKKSVCKTFLKNQLFDSDKRRDFSVDKEKLITLLIGTSIYQSQMECIREYLQNAMDASKMQLWIDLQNGKHDFLKNDEIFDCSQLTPFDLDKRVYEEYRIKILLSWNKEKDKIQVQFQDRGIGIEQEYLEKLSSIGTGWHGRKQYHGQLHNMAKWLCPTGGFGIGIQSAFMVTDSVEMVTKSDKDAYGYRVTLNKPTNRGGTVTVTQLDYMPPRGTSITFEIDPEKFQSWPRWLAKQNNTEIEYLGQKKEYEYNLETWDDFDEDGILIYVTSFFEKYVQAFVPNPLFPISVESSLKKPAVYENAYWPTYNYWNADKGKYIELREQNKDFLGIYVPMEYRRRQHYFLVWNKTDGVYMRIIIEPPHNKIVCFKNIVVRDFDKSQLDLFSRYNICVDFMGFSVEKSLHLHRNSFLESFRFDAYFYECFRVYLRFLKEQLDYVEDDNSNKVILGLEDELFINEWKSYYLQLMIAIGFQDLADYFSEFGNNEKICVTKIQGTTFEEMTKYQTNGENWKILDNVYRLNRAMNRVPNSENETSVPTILINECKESQKSKLDGSVGVALAAKSVENYLNNNMGDTADAKRKKAILDTIFDVGIIEDEDTIRILLSDSRFYTTPVTIISKGIQCYQLKFDPKIPVVSEADLFSYIWDSKARKRVVIKGESIPKYRELQVVALPFREDRKNSYVISPLSKRAIQNVEQELYRGVVLTYDKFREIVWGEVGKESSSYSMLIDWVEKNQLHAGKYRKKEIQEYYEVFLKDIYKECIHKKNQRKGK